MDAQRLAKRVERLQIGFDRAAIVEDRLILLIVAEHRHDDDLVRRDARRTAQPVVVAVGHDDAADHPRRHAPAGRVAQAVAAVPILVTDARGIGEAGAEIMRGAGLQRLAVLHHRLDRIGRDGSREALILGLFAGNDGHREHILGKGAVHFERAQRFGHRVGLVCVRGMAFLPKKFAGAQEHARAHLPAHDIRPLVDLKRQVAPALHPAAHGGADHGFRGRADDQRFFQLCLGIRDQLSLAVLNQAMVGDDCHFLCETIDMVGFLLKEAQGNEQREIAVLDAGVFDRGVHHRLDALPDAIAPRLDHHAAAHPRFLGEVGFGNDILIPGREIGLPGYAERMFDHEVSVFLSLGRRSARLISFSRVRL